MGEPKGICAKCGKIHVTHWGNASCTAHKRGSDPLEPCSKEPRSQLTVCRNHGGNTILARQFADEKLGLLSAQGEIGQLMRECDIPEQNPVDGLLEVVRVSGAMMRLLTIKVGELAEDPSTNEILIEGKDGALSTKEVAGRDGFWGLSKDSEMTVHPYVTLLRIWSERYERACKTCLDAGIAERQVNLAESQGELVGLAVKGILQALNLTPEQWEIAPRIVATQLRALT